MLGWSFIASLGLAMVVGPSVSFAAQGKVGPYAHAHGTAPATVAQATTAQTNDQSMPPADFGSPPSGEIPILFNDHHVYAKPDTEKNNRVLAALVRDGTILVPLRSMFEQMGATVSYNGSTKTVDVSKPGADVQVTVGKPEVVINGESRPLDVPPEIYHGTVLVPLRVLSEGMGAYVQWLPDRRVVVVRYITAAPPTPAPTEAPTPVPTAPPTPAPAPTASPYPYEAYAVGDYIFSPKVYNELSPGNSGTASYRAAGAVEFPAFGGPWMLGADYRSFGYPHNALAASGTCPIAGDPGCVTAIGTQGQTYVPSFQARDSDVDIEFGPHVGDPRIYFDVAYMFRNTNYEGGAFPGQQHGVGFGLDKLPDLDHPFSIYGSVFYFPNLQTNGLQTIDTLGDLGHVTYRDLKYNVGAALTLGKTP
ncbi:MAG: copper amine oxidase N-terminal domain-containing protein, partial [Vulcanimicrobiaceae bacterium]